MQRININSYVRVKLTDEGRRAVASFDKNIHDSIEDKRTLVRAENIDEDGYIKLQLWELMRVFGNHCGVEANNLFENNDLYIYDRSLAKVDL